jgi:hypothetical protein
MIEQMMRDEIDERFTSEEMMRERMATWEDLAIFQKKNSHRLFQRLSYTTCILVLVHQDP